MTNELTIKEESPVAAPRAQADQGTMYDHAKIELLKNTICKGSSDDEFQLFLHVCQRSGLDPFARQIYAVKRSERQKDGQYREVMTIQTGIDGFRLIADRTGRYCPGRAPTYDHGKNGELLCATAYIKKQTHDGTWHEVSATAHYSEYCQRTRDGTPTRFWGTMAHSQLAKCAEALALRKSFPADLSGLYTCDEMRQATVQEPQPPKKIEPLVQHEIITEEQAIELTAMVAECDTSYQTQLYATLIKPPFCIQNLYQLPVILYERIKKAALKKWTENQQKTPEVVAL